ncbi:RNA polymerase sigma factor [Gelidibacter sp.]|uniref:RNA polymerase sigma factor n=1 Tax=Gelidibacter sp. TaxID=2018083 RepID=UPI002CDC2FC7|nr:RNA polymerase sigma factor [Gelidibacter sp.]HUH28793.1 RNA polymerase sigma factor [Gelidibacter sp.]
MNNIDDQHHINQIIAGNSDEFAVLVDRYKDLVFTLAYKMVKNREEAEEVAQDAFVKTYKSLHTFKGESKFSTWVYKITYHTCLDHLKRRKKENSIVYIEDFNELHIKAIEDVLGDIDEKERNKKVQDCLHLLSGDDAFLLTLYYFDDLSTEEISIVMGINANNIKVKLFRSRKKLASILRERLGPEVVDYYERERR